MGYPVSINRQTGKIVGIEFYIVSPNFSRVFNVGLNNSLYIQASSYDLRIILLTHKTNHFF